MKSWIRIFCLLDTSAISALEVLDDYCAILIYLLTYLLTFVSDIAIFVLKRDVKLQLTN